MAQPSVTLNTQDGNLGALPASGGRPLVIVGVSSTGTLNVPTPVSRDSALISTFGKGPAVDAASLHIKKTGKPVLFVRSGDTTVGSYATIDVTGVTGTSVVTVDAGTEPDNDYELKVRIVVGGTIASPGITYQTSRDDGRNWSAILALGVATSIIVADTGGAAFDCAAGTLVAADEWTIVATAPRWTVGELTTAMTAVRNNAVAIELIELVGPCVAADVAEFSSQLSGMGSIGKRVAGFCHYRMRAAAETAATYDTAFDAEFSATASTYVELGGGDAEQVVDGMVAKRPCMIETASRTAALPASGNAASPLLGGMSAIIKDSLGNEKHHDERLSPGLQDSRASVLRTFAGVAGVYPNKNQLLSAAGSDFALMPHRRVFNKALEALDTYFTIRLNSAVRVDKTTGYIVESDALEIENGAKAAMKAALLATPDASAVSFTLNRDDNLLSSSTITGDAKITPLAYLEQIVVGVGFYNPALITA